MILDASDVNMAITEVEIQRKLKHENIIRILAYRVKPSPNMQYVEFDIIMDYAEGNPYLVYYYV